MKIYDLKVNHIYNPVGFKMDDVVFSWKVKNAIGTKQKNAQLIIARDQQLNEVIYDSGFRKDIDSLAFSVDINLTPRTRYYWQVTVESNGGDKATSDIQFFETGKMNEPWHGKWISCSNNSERLPIFKKAIRLNEKVNKARLYICGLGLYEAYYNDNRISDEYLTPYCNDYNEWVQYQTFDVTDLLTSDGNLSVILGNGWYKGRFGFNSINQNSGFYGNEFKLIAELQIEYADGKTEIVYTDDSWEVIRSNIVFSNIYDGEWVDETIEDTKPEVAFYCDAPCGNLTERMSLMVRQREKIEPIQLIHTPARELVFDMGQEFTGIFELKINEPAGTKIHIQTGEVLQQGNFYNENLRSAKSEFYFTTSGGKKIIRPRFTFYGYRYVKVEGVSNLSVDDFTGIALYSELESVGFVQTGHDLVNKLISNVEWGLKSNFLDVPTDCPQRDERMGWTGDAQVFSPTAMYLKDSYAFYAKYLYDMKLEQRKRNGKVPDVIPSFDVESTSCVWGDAATIIPWNLYIFYGDKTILSNQYESMKGWVDYIRLVDGDNHNWGKQRHYGDWLALDNMAGNTEAVYGATDEEYIANLYYAVSATILSKAALVLGFYDDEKYYLQLANKQIAFIKREYYSQSGRCCIKTMTALLLTLKYNLSDNIELTTKQLRKLFADNNDHLMTGFVGTPLINNILTENGMSDMAYKLLLNEEYPGWLREIKLGATTIWERWNSLLDDGKISGISMNSMNHYSYGAVLEWVFRHVAGINVLEESAGAREISISPVLNWELRCVKACYDSAAGKYEVRWCLLDYDKVKINIIIPFGCKAKVTLPLSDTASFELKTGEYEYCYKLNKSLKLVYNLDTPIRILKESEKVSKALEGLLDFDRIPQQYLSVSLNEMTKEYSGLTRKSLERIEERLAGLSL